MLTSALRPYADRSYWMYLPPPVFFILDIGPSYCDSLIVHTLAIQTLTPALANALFDGVRLRGSLITHVFHHQHVVLICILRVEQALKLRVHRQPQMSITVAFILHEMQSSSHGFTRGQGFQPVPGGRKFRAMINVLPQRRVAFGSAGVDCKSRGARKLNREARKNQNCEGQGKFPDSNSPLAQKLFLCPQLYSRPGPS
jgi:hypothetical protein